MTEPKTYSYQWPVTSGTRRVAHSPIDALLDVLGDELGIAHRATLFAQLDLHAGNVTRCRQGTMEIPHVWLMRASIVSGFEYSELCQLVGEEPEVRVWER